MIKNQTNKQAIINLTSIMIFSLVLLLFIGILVWPVINQTNHTGFEPYYLTVPISIAGLSLFFLSLLSSPKRKLSSLGLLISLLSLLLLFSYKQFNIMLNYDEWLTCGMPNRFEEVPTMFWIRNDINATSDSTEYIYENENYRFKRDLDLNNAIAFIIEDQNTGQEVHLMSHDGDRFEVTKDDKYFIQYRMHITSNTYQTATFLSVYDLYTGKLIKKSTSFDLNLDLSKDITDDEWFSIYIDFNDEGSLNFYNQEDNTITVPVKQCLNGQDNECTILDPYLFRLDQQSSF